MPSDTTYPPPPQPSTVPSPLPASSSSMSSIFSTLTVLFNTPLVPPSPRSSDNLTEIPARNERRRSIASTATCESTISRGTASSALSEDSIYGGKSMDAGVNPAGVAERRDRVVEVGGAYERA